MNALFICQRKMLPLNDGACVYSFGILQYLKEIGINTTFISFYETEDYTRNEVEELENLCGGVYSVKLTWRSIALNTSLKYPNSIQKYTRQAMFRKLKQVMENAYFDIVFIDHLHMFEYSKLFKNSRVILIEHNVEADVWLNFVKKCPGIIKLFVKRNAIMTYEYEKRAIQSVFGVISISELDAQKLKSMTPEANIYVMHPYISYKLVKTPADILKTNMKLLFIGSYGWYPNQEAAKFLVEQVMPILRKHLPGIHLFLVGKEPTNEIIKYGKTYCDITITGTVKSTDTYIRSCDLLINPIFSGSGLNLKMLEAMGKGIPVVSSEYGARGINIIPFKHALIFKDVHECVDCIIKLLKDKEKAIALSVAAREHYMSFIQPDKRVYDLIMGN